MKRLAICAALSLAFTPVLAPCGTAANQAQSLTMLAKRFVNESERRDPLFADGLGLHVYDAYLDDYSEHGARARAVGRA